MSFYLSALAGLLVWGLALALQLELGAVLAADTFFLSYTVLAFIAVSRLTPERLSRYAASADAPAWIIFAVATATVAMSIVALFMTVNETAQISGWQLALTLAAVPLGWATIHLMAALHYAHVYWRPGTEETDGDVAAGGLEFPGTKQPGGWDFAYFAFVVGMTAQTADTNVTATHMRRLVLLHGVTAYFFNTVIVAAAVNVAVSLGG